MNTLLAQAELDRLEKFRSGATVMRNHTMRTIKQQTIAEHSHGVTLVLLSMYATMGSLPSAKILAVSACHDLSEVVTGDVPAPAKWQNPDLKRVLNEVSTSWERNLGIRFELSPLEEFFFSVADAVDFGLFACDEVTMGNLHMLPALKRISKRVEELQLKTPEICPPSFCFFLDAIVAYFKETILTTRGHIS